MGVAILKNYVNGTWVDPERAGLLEVTNPSTGETIVQVPLSSAAAVNETVDAAAAAFGAWSRTPVSRRCEYLFRLAGLLRDNFEPIARGLAEEMGKSLPDARAEMKRTLENCEVACGTPSLMQGEKLIGCGPDIDADVLLLPVGVFAIGFLYFWRAEETYGRD